MLLSEISNIEEILIFEIGGDKYAVDAGDVEEIIVLPQETLLPTVESSAASIINHKSEIFTTISLASALYGSLALDDKSTLAMIVEFEIRDNKKIFDDIRKLAFKISANPPYKSASDYNCEKIPNSTQYNRRYMKYTLYNVSNPNEAIKFINLQMLVTESFYVNK